MNQTECADLIAEFKGILKTYNLKEQSFHESQKFEEALSRESDDSIG